MDTTNDRVNILLVDDQPGNLTALETILEDLGLNLVKATSGEAALRHLLKADFAVILLDVMMPGLDGFETAALIRERERTHNTPIIFLTAASKSEDLVFKGYSAGAVDYLFKPVQPEILRSKVAVFVDLFRKTEKVKRQAEHLQQQNEALEAFTYSVTHDLRAPLRAMQTFSQILLEEFAGQLDPVGREYAGHIATAAQRMDTLIRDLLAYSRLSRADLQPQRLDLATVVAEALAQVETDVRGRQARVTVAEPMPAVVGHGATATQVVANLLSNATKFIAPGVQPEVRVWAEPSGERVRLWVADNGIGIAPEDCERVFRPFERLHGVDEYPGTGIGLAIVRQGMERMGGCVGVESRLGQGSRFWIELPPRGGAL